MKFKFILILIMILSYTSIFAEDRAIYEIKNGIPILNITNVQVRDIKANDIKGRIIESPVDVKMNEIVRSRLRVFDGVPSVDTDIYVWGVGKSANQEITRIGGLPSMDIKDAWPSRNGKPLTFFCQWNLFASKDIISKNIQGDILMMFGDITHDDGYVDIDDDSVVFVWKKLGDIVNRIEKQPDGVKLFPELFGVKYRTQEYPSLSGNRILSSLTDGYLLSRTQATRVGGDTWYIQIDGPNTNEKLLCTLSSVGTMEPKDMFFVNVRNGSKELFQKNYIMLGDVGCIYVFIDDNGKLRFKWDCY